MKIKVGEHTFAVTSLDAVGSPEEALAQYAKGWDAGMPWKPEKKAEMHILGSSIFGAQDPYRFRKQDGTFGMRPRPNAYSRPGTDGWTFIHSDWFLRVAQQAWNAVVEHETQMGCADILFQAKQIPSTLRLRRHCRRHCRCHCRRHCCHRRPRCRHHLQDPQSEKMKGRKTLEGVAR